MKKILLNKLKALPEWVFELFIYVASALPWMLLLLLLSASSCKVIEKAKEAKQEKKAAAYYSARPEKLAAKSLQILPDRPTRIEEGKPEIIREIKYVDTSKAGVIREFHNTERLRVDTMFKEDGPLAAIRDKQISDLEIKVEELRGKLDGALKWKDWFFYLLAVNGMFIAFFIGSRVKRFI